MTATKQLSAWQGEFGRAYTDRNQADPAVLAPAFREILSGLQLRRVLEVGCNRGHNLAAIAQVCGPECEVVGVEPNDYAREYAKQFPGISTVAGNAYNLPFGDGEFDLVFTLGVLIHISLADLPRALSEIHRVSRRYVLAMEYFAEQEMTIEYRGHNDLLWKRNFLAHYQQQFPGLQVVRSGYLNQEGVFDRLTWWLLEKPGPTLSQNRL